MNNMLWEVQGSIELNINFSLCTGKHSPNIKLLKSVTPLV